MDESEFGSMRLSVAACGSMVNPGGQFGGIVDDCNRDFSTAERLTYRQLISSH